MALKARQDFSLENSLGENDRLYMGDDSEAGGRGKNDSQVFICSMKNVVKLKHVDVSRRVKLQRHKPIVHSHHSWRPVYIS